MATIPSGPPWLSERMFRAVYERATVLSEHYGAKVILFDDDLVLKVGGRVSAAEEIAMRLIKQHTIVPVPDVEAACYDPHEGRLAMSYIPGTTLDKIWADLDAGTKETLCYEIWNMITQLRQVPKPSGLPYLCRADGSHSWDPLVCDKYGHPQLFNDDAVRARIYERYYINNGRKYEQELPDMLPRSAESVFCHGDLAPKNIMCDPISLKITGIIDWEFAGWYPDWWEYAGIMGPMRDKDWQAWMDHTAPQRWDISGIAAARFVSWLPC